MNEFFREHVQPIENGVRTKYGDIVVKPGYIEEIAGFLRAKEDYWSGFPAFIYPGKKRYAIITDSTVARLYGDRLYERLKDAGLDVGLFEFDEGEDNKTIETYSKLADKMEAKGYGRNNSVVIALGGGVVGDIAGYVAATFKRGIPYIQVPTTLLAQVDSSIGGKVGVNTQFGKNLLGTFYHPRSTFVDPDTLTTLPDRDYRSGLAEVIKYGTIDWDFLQNLESNLDALLVKDMNQLSSFILDSLIMKSYFVSTDPYDKGTRQILNFGHTIGQGVEAASNYDLSHGEAVSIGMSYEGKFAVSARDWKQEELDRLTSLLQRAGLPTEIPENLDREKIIEAIRHDKKGKMKVVLPHGLSSPLFLDSLYAFTEIGERELKQLLSE